MPLDWVDLIVGFDDAAAARVATVALHLTEVVVAMRPNRRKI